MEELTGKAGIDPELLAQNRERIRKARNLIPRLIRMEPEDDGALSGFYHGYYLQVNFSEVHPLMVFSLVKPYYLPLHINMFRTLNRANLQCILGSHIINGDVGCYSFRLTQWLFSDLTEEQFLQLLDRSLAAAEQGFAELLPESNL